MQRSIGLATYSYLSLMVEVNVSQLHIWSLRDWQDIRWWSESRPSGGEVVYRPEALLLLVWQITDGRASPDDTCRTAHPPPLLWDIYNIFPSPVLFVFSLASPFFCPLLTLLVGFFSVSSTLFIHVNFPSPSYLRLKNSLNSIVLFKHNSSWFGLVISFYVFVFFFYPNLLPQLFSSCFPRGCVWS